MPASLERLLDVRQPHCVTDCPGQADPRGLDHATFDAQSSGDSDNREV
jgi:hypothetical protein